EDMSQSAPVDEPQHNPQDEIAKAHREFKEKNTWYDSDPALQAAANGISQGFDPNMSVHENLRQTEAKIKELFPEKFRPPKIRNDAVDGGGVFSNVAKKAGPSASLPKEALAQAKVDVANGTYKNVDEWAKAYNEGVGTYD
ncbi:MAG: hypothetical protein GY941_07555, partial [Planctomycetes bacterium]|nr:hypothetical protein [Planctomycetota bacterium]